MSDYPEHDKLSAVAAETQAAGEFVEWLELKGIHLMQWREDLTDTRPTDPECKVRRDRENPRSCDQGHDDGDHSVMYWMRHCLHWEDSEREATGSAVQGKCCYCGKTDFYEITGIKSWVNAPSFRDLLAEWAQIDQNKIEAEKRRMLASIRAAQ